MFEKTYRVLSLVAALGVVHGRKKLQKTAFLLQHWGTDLMSRFSYHFYGPYSADLQAAVRDLVDRELLQEEQEKGGYVYRITEKGQAFIRKWEGQFGGEHPFAIPQELLERLQGQSAPFLELLSTYAFLLETGDDPEEASKKAQRLKPHLAPLVDEVIRFYEEVRA
jgi:hypothetical protein